MPRLISIAYACCCPRLNIGESILSRKARIFLRTIIVLDFVMNLILLACRVPIYHDELLNGDDIVQGSLTTLVHITEAVLLMDVSILGGFGKRGAMRFTQL